MTGFNEEISVAYSPLAIIKNMRSMKEREEAMAEQNPHLAQALEQEKMEGHRLAVVARTVAMGIIACLLPFLNPNFDVLYYEAFVLLFIALGWIQYKYAQVGYSKIELAFIIGDLVLLTAIFLIPNPFQRGEFPTAMLYRFDNFVYFFLILAISSLAYSWRTVWSIGTWIAIMWAIGYVCIEIWGYKIPQLDQLASAIFQNYDLMGDVLQPNSARLPQRVQEIVVILLVAGILALKGYRTNQLIMRQAEVSEERANLSRYFPSSLVDAIASTEHDIGAVRSQEVAVLFTDIVGFTQYAERNAPEDVMDLLRDYHALVEKAIFENGGTLEKYMGDGVMATFGRPETSAEDAANALRAARQIMNDNEAFNAKRETDGQEAVHISLGIHYGAVILGDIGPERRLEFAVVGDTVNVAARLESETRKLDCQCVVSDEVMRHVADSTHDDTLKSTFKEYGNLSIRGRKQPINIWVN